MAQDITKFNFSLTDRGPVIGPLQYGIFFEEINHAGEGGLYAELVRNGSFEEEGALDYWHTVGNAQMSLAETDLLNSAQQRALSLTLEQAGDGVRNEGFWGMNIVKGQRYKASFWVRTESGWEGDLALMLETKGGNSLGYTIVHVAEADSWTKYSVEIIATGNAPQGRFALKLVNGIDPSATVTPSTICLDCISLFPPTFKDRPNGMRKDLAEKLAALHPRFMRFPGGCYIEGGNRFQWKNTVGPVEERRGIYNSYWGYPVSNGMGYHEFLQLAEDLGAEPLFVVNIGLGHGWCQDYQHIEEYIQEALDALEYANGSTDTYWGKMRATMGHPQPFGLRLIEIGNENYNYSMDNNDDQSDHYPERYKQIRDAIKAHYPDVVCIGNTQWGTDNPTWRNEYEVEMVDEHYYKSPDWFAANYHKYDKFSRTGYKVYNGEYAVAMSDGTFYNTLKAALGEAIYMAGMERNSDVCVMASYAPIFQNENDVQWDPDMIHFNASESYGTPSYWVQQMMASNVGHQNLTWTSDGNITMNAHLGLGSWNTDVTYTNIRVTAEDGTVTYTSDQAFTSPASTQGTEHVFDISTENCTIELDAVKNSGKEGFLITFAYVNSMNFAWWNLGGWNNDHHAVELCLDGTKTSLGTASGYIETGRTYHIKIVRKGMQAECYLDDKLLQTITLTPELYQSSTLYLCAALNEAEDSAIVKIINYENAIKPALLQFEGMVVDGTSDLIVLSHNDNLARNSMESPMNVSPVQQTLSATDGKLHYDVPPYSLSVLTIPLSTGGNEHPHGDDPTIYPFDGDMDGDGHFGIEDVTLFIKMYLEKRSHP